MLDFILAGALYIAFMFFIFFCLSFVTIGITYTAATLFKRIMLHITEPSLALK